MYTVKQAAQLTGIPEATLRIWERRYGIVEPHRSPSGYRLYDDAQLARLRSMAAQVRAGVPASHAATAILAAAEAWPVAAVASDTDDLVAAAASLDSVGLEQLIERAFGRAEFEQVADGWILPQIGALGDAWAEGRLTVAQEHFASAALMRAIGSVFDAAAKRATGSAVLVGLPAGERHELALYAFATCLRRRGINVVYLGADIPTAEWEQAAAERGARAAVIGVSSRRAIGVAQSVVDLLTELRPPVSAWVGGSRRGKVTGAQCLPDGVAEAAAILQLNLTTGRA